MKRKQLSILAVIAILAPITGNMAWLGCLGFLCFLGMSDNETD